MLFLAVESITEVIRRAIERVIARYEAAVFVVVQIDKALGVGGIILPPYCLNVD